MPGEEAMRSPASARAMRPAPITRQRCMDQARRARDAATTAPSAEARGLFLTTAMAYERLAAKAALAPRKLGDDG